MSRCTHIFLLLKRRCFVQDHEYLVEPVSVQATMRRNVSLLPLRASDTPRLALDITLQKFVVALSERQYRDMVLWMKEIDRYDRAYKYRKWRPTCTVRDRSVNNNTKTSIALKSSGTQAQKRNKIKSLIIFKILGRTGFRSKYWVQQKRKHACPGSV